MKEYPLKVRYYETDMQGIVHHSNYLRWFEVAREHFVESELDTTFPNLEALGIFYVLRDAQLTYLKPIRYGDPVILRIGLEKYNGIRLQHYYEICTNNEVCVTGRTELIAVDKEDFKPINMRRFNPSIHEKTLEALENKE